LQPNQTTYNTIIHAHAHQGYFDEAQKWLLRMQQQGLQPDTVTFTAIISGLAKLGTSSRGQSLLAKEWFVKLRDAGLKPNVVTYAEIIRSCVADHNVSLAEEMFHDMSMQSVSPNAVVVDSLLNVHSTARDQVAAERVLRIMVKQKISPSIVSYGLVIKAAARAGDFYRASAWAVRVSTAHLSPDAKIYHALLSACAQVHDVVAALDVIARMTAGGIPHDVVSFSTLLHTCANAANLREAERQFSAMQDAGVKPNSYTLNAMVNACVRADAAVEAERWFMKVIRMGSDVKMFTYNGVIRAWAVRGDPHRTRLWCDRMWAATVTPDHTTHLIIIKACAWAGDAEGALEVYQRMLSEGHRPNLSIYHTLLKQMALTGNYLQARHILDHMQDAFEPDKYSKQSFLLACANSEPPAAREAEQEFRASWHLLHDDPLAVQCLERTLEPMHFSRLTKRFGLQSKAKPFNPPNRHRENLQQSKTRSSKFSLSSTSIHDCPSPLKEWQPLPPHLVKARAEQGIGNDSNIDEPSSPHRVSSKSCNNQAGPSISRSASSRELILRSISANLGTSSSISSGVSTGTNSNTNKALECASSCQHSATDIGMGHASSLEFSASFKLSPSTSCLVEIGRPNMTPPRRSHNRKVFELAEPRQNTPFHR